MGTAVCCFQGVSCAKSVVGGMVFCDGDVSVHSRVTLSSHALHSTHTRNDSSALFRLGEAKVWRALTQLLTGSKRSKYPSSVTEKTIEQRQRSRRAQKYCCTFAHLSCDGRSPHCTSKCITTHLCTKYNDTSDTFLCHDSLRSTR